jgi:pantetheine-phosphate adenylyltransferase
MTHRIAIYPGSFDPITLGHLNIIQRAKSAVDELIVAVVRNPGKDPMFTAAERVEMIETLTCGCPGVTVESFEGLLIHYVRSRGAKFIIRGLRAVSDFEYEFQMAVQNRHLAPEVDTLYMMTEAQHFYVSSRMAKEIAMLDGDVSHMVPELVVQRMRDKRRTP